MHCALSITQFPGSLLNLRRGYFSYRLLVAESSGKHVLRYMVPVQHGDHKNCIKGSLKSIVTVFQGFWSSITLETITLPTPDKSVAI